MDFARKQLEKYGWSDGKGLGKHENGISQALKPKIKRSVTGIGHDPAADFTEHWWSALYDKAAKNVEVKEKNGKTKKIKTKDDEFEITNSTYHLKKKKKKNGEEQEEYSEFFVKTAVLDGVREKTTKNKNELEEDGHIAETEDKKEKKDVFKMTDEELFAACEGRTAHKGARHGLKATGKLARIQRQEQLLLTQPQYNGYSHAKRIKRKHEKNGDDSNNTEHTGNSNKCVENYDTVHVSKEEESVENASEVVVKKKKKRKSFSNELNNKCVNKSEEDSSKYVENYDEVVENSNESDKCTTEGIQKKKKQKHFNELCDGGISKSNTIDKQKNCGVDREMINLESETKSFVKSKWKKKNSS